MEDNSTVPSSPAVKSASPPFTSPLARFILDESHARPKQPVAPGEGHDLGYYSCECPCCLRMREQGFSIARMQINGAFDMVEKKIVLQQEKLLKEIQHSQALLSELTTAHEEIQYLENLLRMTQDDLHNEIQKNKFVVTVNEIDK